MAQRVVPEQEMEPLEEELQHKGRIMGYTSEQVRQIYNTRMSALYRRLSREEREQAEADAERAAKAQEDIAIASLILSTLGMAKDIRENIVLKRLDQTYGIDTNELGQLPKKFELRDPVEWGEFVPKKGDMFAPIKATGKALRGVVDATEKTEGYKEHLRQEEQLELDKQKAQEQLDEVRGYQAEEGQGKLKAIPVTEADIQTAEKVAPTDKKYDAKKLTDMLKRSGVDLEGVPEEHVDTILTKMDKVVKEGDVQDYEAFIQVIEKGTTENSQLADTVMKDFLNNPDEVVESHKNMTYTPGQTPVDKDSARKELEALEAKDLQDKKLDEVRGYQAQYESDMAQSESDIWNKEQTDNALEELKTAAGEFQEAAPEMDAEYIKTLDEDTKRMIYDEWYNEVNAQYSPEKIAQLEATDPNFKEKGYKQWLKRVESGELTGAYTRNIPVSPRSPDVPVSEDTSFIDPEYKDIGYDDDIFPAPQPDHTGIQTASDLAQDRQLQKLRDVEKPSSLFKSHPGMDMNERQVKGKVAESMGVTKPEVSPEMEKALQEMEDVFDEEGNVIPEKKKLLDFLKKDKGVTPDQMYASAGSTDVGMELLDDKKISVGDVAGKTIGAAQTLKGAYDVGSTILDEDATDLQKGLAGTRGVKAIADPIFKKGTNKLVEEAVKKTTLELGKKAGTEAGKVAIKAAEKEAKEQALKSASAKVASGAGAVLGAYTAYTGVKGAEDAWGRGDKDEAILHGISAWGGSLNAIGGGLVATGIGAPLGGILMGIGTAASLFGGIGLTVEGMLEEDEQQQVFDTRRYQRRHRYDPQAHRYGGYR